MKDIYDKSIDEIASFIYEQQWFDSWGLKASGCIVDIIEALKKLEDKKLGDKE